MQYQIKLITTNSEPEKTNSIVLGDYLFTLLPDSGLLTVRNVYSRKVSKKTSLENFTVKNTMPLAMGDPTPYNSIAFDRLHIVVMRSNSDREVHACIWSPEIFALFGAYRLKDGVREVPYELQDGTTKWKLEKTTRTLQLSKDYGARSVIDYLIRYEVIPRKFANLATAM